MTHNRRSAVEDRQIVRAAGARYPQSVVEITGFDRADVLIASRAANPRPEKLGKVYFTPLMTPLPVATRLPQPAPNQETISTFLRLQSGGGNQRPDTFLWDMSLILHSYAPNEQEGDAEENLATAVAWGANAAGQSITLRNGDTYYVTYSRANALSHRQQDPYVDLIRYRSMVTWRVQGLAIGPGG